MTDLEDAFSITARGSFRDAKGKVDEAAWTAWLATKSLQGLPEDVRTARAKKLAAAKPRFLKPDGSFNDTAWREWLDMRLRAEVFDLAKAHLEYRERWLVIKYYDSMSRIEELFSMLNGLSRARSRELYERFKLPFAAEDSDDASNPLHLGSGGRVGPAFVELAMKRIAHTCDITPEEEKAAAEQAAKEQRENQ
jgi:hypothetical protein